MSGLGTSTSTVLGFVVAPEISFNDKFVPHTWSLKTKLIVLTQIRNQLALETVRRNHRFGTWRSRRSVVHRSEDFIDQLNDQGASIRGEQVTVAGLIAPDAKIKIKNTRIGNFEIEGTRTFRDGQDLLNEVLSQDATAYKNATGNSGHRHRRFAGAFEALNSSIEARPEIEAAMEESSQEVEALNAEIDRLQADADVLRASISEVDTGVKSRTPRLLKRK